ncbi:MAG: hypothetical protein ACE5HE_08360 [Phycisphaerae bacterium]
MSTELHHGGSMRCRRRLLMVASAFPPAGGPGVQRCVKFAKYLPRFGWRPIIWTRDHVDDLPDDSSLLEDLPPDVTVCRHGDDSALRTLQRALERHACGGGWTSHAARAAKWRLCAWSSRTQSPDDCVSWAQASIRPLLRLISHECIDALWSTFSPASNHLLALALKRETQLPWIADFRDLWTEDYRYCEPSTRRRRAHRRWEREILEFADVVTGVTDRQTEILSRRSPHAYRKFMTITNGFDEEDFYGMAPGPAENDPHTPKRRFVLAHVGKLDRWRANDTWLAGLERFVSGLGASGTRFSFRVVGHVNSQVRKRLAALGAACTFTGYLSHHGAIAEMRSADALLLPVPDGPNADSVVPAKTYEYLAAQRPILVVGPNGGACESLVCACEAGIAVGFDVAAVEEALGRLYGAWQANAASSVCARPRLARYSRRLLTKELVRVLDHVVDGGGNSPRPSAVPVPAYA